MNSTFLKGLTILILAFSFSACSAATLEQPPNIAVSSSSAAPSPSIIKYIQPQISIMPKVVIAPMPSIKLPTFPQYGSSVYPEPSPQNANVYPAEIGSPGIKAVFSGCCSTSYFIIKTDGSLWAWGYNGNGELGIRSNNTVKPPEDGSYAKTAVKVMDGVKFVSAGKYHTMILKEDGSLWACGDNQNGQLGVEVDKCLSPVKVMDNVLTAAAGIGHSLAIKVDGSLWAWGKNDYGQVGNGKKKNQPKPVKIMSGVKEVAAGSNFSMALKEDGTLYSWGDNGSGQLGDGTKTIRTKPRKITGGVEHIAAGSGRGIMILDPASYMTIMTGPKKVHGFWTLVPKRVPSTWRYQPHRDGDFSLAIKSDGTLWAWGRNKDGQLGDGTKKDRKKPVKIMDGVIKAEAGGSFTLALKADRSLWTWGAKGFQQINGGMDSPQTSPSKLMEGVVDIAASWKGMIILKTDGYMGECLTADTTPCP